MFDKSMNIFKYHLSEKLANAFKLDFKILGFFMS